jgi:hypothetical protein
MPRFPRRSISRLTWSLASATLCVTAPAFGQDTSTGRVGPVWTLEGLRSGRCVRFLMDPRVVSKEVRSGLRPLRADQDSSLHPALQSIIGDQAEFAPWTPASLCLFYSDAIRVGSRRLASKDPRKQRMLGYWTVATTGAGGVRQDMVLELFGTGGDLADAAETGKVKLREARSSVSKAAGTDHDLYDVTIGKTRLIWNGRAVGDTALAGQTIQGQWLTRGASGTFWRVDARLRATTTRPLVGVLTIEGKDDLAKALKASPTRFVGPVYLGGEGVLRFYR